MGNDISDALRSEVADRAKHRCEYCLIHENDTGFRLQVDHIISRKHGGLSVLENLAYACVICNRRKGSDVASVDERSGEIVRLFHPRQDRSADHFELDTNTIRAASDAGTATAALLRFNAPERLAERGLLQALGRYPIKA
ncbi:MAG: HNH endonuclease [Acidobacteriota bacterium]